MKYLIVKIVALIFLFLSPINPLEYGIGFGVGLGDNKGPQKLKFSDANHLCFIPRFNFLSWRKLSFIVETSLSLVMMAQNDFEFGLSPLIEFQFLKKKITPYFVGGIGFDYTTSNVPTLNKAHFNFLDQLGFGLKFGNKKVAFRIEYRYRHISNLNNTGINTNLFLTSISFVK